MKKHFSILALLVLAQTASAETFYNQLCEFNSNWKNYEAQAPKGEARIFNSDRDYIQAHLSSVLPILRSNAVDHLSGDQLLTRFRLIEMLDEYRIAGRFPMNYYRKKRTPVFIDQHNTHCAVGYLMQQSGNDDLAGQIAAVDNYAWVKDITVDGLSIWQKFSGFSVDELKLIQGAYDSYMPNAFILPNRYEIPQKPAVMVAHFESLYTDELLPQNEENIWCRGEGAYGVLNGRWEQNFATGVPWIVGFYQDGKRTGQWEEFYQGTDKLCRTENWRDDKLNGVRRRFNREGVIIEEIVFKDGSAVTKTNYDRVELLKWIRTPLDSNLVCTEVFDFGGAMIASGHERVHNPGNLLWFQNIELTALNSFAITSRDAGTRLDGGNGVFVGRNQPRLFSTPPLVEYKKEGEWMYFKEYSAEYAADWGFESAVIMLNKHYKHFGKDLAQSIMQFNDLIVKSNYDSVRVVYKENLVQEFFGYGFDDYTHLLITYQDGNIQPEGSVLNYEQIYSVYGLESGAQHKVQPRVAVLGQYNKNHLRIGVWKHFDESGQLYKTERYIIPRKEEELIVGSR